MQQPIVVVGASGFMGAALSRGLLRAGLPVVRYGSPHPRPDAEDDGGTPLDLLRDPIAMPRGIQGVFYLAQSRSYRQFPAQADDLFGVNTWGAVRAACAAREAGAGLFCYASTGNVYQPAFTPLSESSPVRRDNGYALSKVMAEDALALLAGNMQVVCVRFFGVFGPGQRGMLVPNIGDRLRGGQPVLLDAAPTGIDDPGEGLRVSLCYLDDAVACLMRLRELAAEGTSLPRLLNVAGPEAVSLRRLAVEAGRALAVEPRFESSGKTRAFDLVADIQRLTTLAEPRFQSFEQAMQATFAPK